MNELDRLNWVGMLIFLIFFIIFLFLFYFIFFFLGGGRGGGREYVDHGSKNPQK